MFKLTEAHTMRATATAVVFALVAISAVSARSCEPADCGTGPVYAYFQYENCSGTVTYSTYDGQLDVCTSGTGDSHINRLYSTHIDQLEYQGVEDCGGGRPDAVATHGYILHFGGCSTVKRANLQYARSFMVLSNVNASYVSPQDQVNDLNVPAFPKSGEQACTSEADCNSKGFFHSQFFTNTTCNAADSVRRVYGAYQAYKCYRDDTNSYIMVGCQGPHTVEYTSFNDPGCTRPVRGNNRGSVCGGTSDSTYYCTAVKPGVTSSGQLFQASSHTFHLCGHLGDGILSPLISY